MAQIVTTTDTTTQTTKRLTKPESDLYDAMQPLFEKRYGPSRQEIADLVGISKNQAAYLVNGLIEKGYLVQDYDAEGKPVPRSLRNA